MVSINLFAAQYYRELSVEIEPSLGTAW